MSEEEYGKYRVQQGRNLSLMKFIIAAEQRIQIMAYRCCQISSNLGLKMVIETVEVDFLSKIMPSIKHTMHIT